MMCEIMVMGGEKYGSRLLDGNIVEQDRGTSVEVEEEEDMRSVRIYEVHRRWQWNRISRNKGHDSATRTDGQ